MMRTVGHAVAVVSVAVLAAACSTSSRDESVNVPANAGVYKIGNPYQIDGTWYYPKEQPDYDETGVASWYGPAFYGKHTANGEMYTAQDLTAAHRTLPMPVNVRVTNLDNGKSLVVRVNDRGPFAKGRIIDVSERAAKLLGFIQNGTAKVRVQFVARADLAGGQPPPSETPAEVASAVPAAPASKLDVGTLAPVSGAKTESTRTSAALPTPAPSSPQSIADLIAANQPTGQVTTVPVPAVTHLYVQVGAFSILSDARRIQARLGHGLVISTIERNRQKLYRVRMGPFNQVAEADRALAQLTGQGSNDARIVVDQ
jgi:rare lipoprotein A